MIHKYLFFITEAIIGMKRSAIMIFVANATVMLCLVVLGLFLLINSNLGYFSKFINSKLEIRVFLKENLTKREINNFKQTLSQLNHVKNVTFIDKKEAWETFKLKYNNLTLDSFIENNPLPHSFTVQLNDQLNIKRIAKTIEGFNKYSSDVLYGGLMADRLQTFSRFIQVFGTSLVIILSFASIFIIMNTIKLTIINRNEEITVMKLVGANDAFITAPFIIEGLLIGVLSSLFAIFLLKIGYDITLVKLQELLPYLPFIQKDSTLNKIYGLVACSGVILTSIAAYASTRSILRQVR